MIRTYNFSQVKYCVVHTSAIRSLLLARAMRAGFETDNADENICARRVCADAADMPLAYVHNYCGLKNFGFSSDTSKVALDGVRVGVQEILDILVPEPSPPQLTSERVDYFGGIAMQTEQVRRMQLPVPIIGRVEWEHFAKTEGIILPALVDLSNPVLLTEWVARIYSDGSTSITKAGSGECVPISAERMKQLIATYLAVSPRFINNQ